MSEKKQNPLFFSIDTCSTKKSQVIKSYSKFDITQESVKNCLGKLEKIKLYKKNKKYIGLTKNFLTDPNFFVLAYLQTKNKSGNMRTVVNKKTFNEIDKSWFVNLANNIKINKYKFKPAKIINIDKTYNDSIKLLTIGSSRDKIVQKAISIIINQIYEYEDKVFLKESHGFRPGRSIHTALKEIKIK